MPDGNSNGLYACTNGGGNLLALSVIPCRRCLGSLALFLGGGAALEVVLRLRSRRMFSMCSYAGSLDKFLSRGCTGKFIVVVRTSVFTCVLVGTGALGVPLTHKKCPLRHDGLLHVFV